MFIKQVVLISSLVIIFVLFSEAYRENIGNEWYRYQQQYKAELKKIATNDREKKFADNYEIKMRQIFLPGLNRVDRCISCHVGIEDSRMAHAKQPLTVHPGNILEDHDIDAIGCTVCHDGQGRAVTAKEAHAVGILYWEKPIVYQPFLQSNCFRCHNADELPQATLYNQGRKIFFTHGCLGCHQLNGKGGQIGQDLSDLADANIHVKYPFNEKLVDRFHGNFNIAYIYECIKNPRARPVLTAMPDFHFSEQEIQSLVVFLKAQSRMAVPSSYLEQRSEGRQPENFKGGALYRKYCVACHGVDAKGGVANRNYVKGTVPALNTLAERMFLEEPEDAAKVAELLEKGVDITAMTPALDVPNRGRVLAQYRAILNVIKRGSVAGKADPNGPEPLLNMPSWTEGLTTKDIDSILSYLLKLYPWEKQAEKNNK